MKLNAVTHWLEEQWRHWSAKPWFWETVPFAAIGIVALLLLVKGFHDISYHSTAEYRIHRLGYPLNEARAIAGVLTNEQSDSLIARGEHDTIAYPIINQRYFIARNFDHYLALHKADTTGAPLPDIIALVNVGYYPAKENKAAPCDTSKGYLMLVNGLHFLDERYKPDSLAAFTRSYCYEDQKARRAVVSAFIELQQECKKQTGAHLMVNSAYRSYEDQIGTYKRNDKRYVAHPGHSEHQTGLAIDATSLQHPEKWSFGKSKEGVWMRENCHKYGFILRYPEKQSRIMGYSYEPWHLRYVGTDAAKQIHDEGISFDEYYAFYLDKR